MAFDRPAIGSGLIALGGAHFLGITDRGPNVDHFPVDGSCTATGGANGKTHPLPQFTPAIVKFRAHGGVLTLTEFVNLVTPAGEGITGLSNLLGADPAFDDPSFDDPCSNIALAANQNGMDVEDFALLPDGKFIGVEENRPSVFIGDLASGVVELRYTPDGIPLPAAGYSVTDSLPAALAQRRKNRGFEAVAVSPDGRTAYTMTQSPLGSNAAGSPYRNSRVLRILRLDVSDPYNASVTGQFVFVMSDRALYTAAGQPTINQRDLKLSAMSWIAPNKLLLLERSDEVGRGGVRLILVDLEGATNLQGLAVADTLAPEDVNNTLSSLNITPVESAVVFEEYQFQGARKFWTYKLEGMAIHNANTVEIINDNDFGIADVIDAPTNLWTVRLADRLPLDK